MCVIAHVRGKGIKKHKTSLMLPFLLLYPAMSGDNIPTKMLLKQFSLVLWCWQFWPDEWHEVSPWIGSGSTLSPHTGIGSRSRTLYLPKKDWASGLHDIFTQQGSAPAWLPHPEIGLCGTWHFWSSAEEHGPWGSPQLHGELSRPDGIAPRAIFYPWARSWAPLWSIPTIHSTVLSKHFLAKNDLTMF